MSSLIHVLKPIDAAGWWTLIGAAVCAAGILLPFFVSPDAARKWCWTSILRYKFLLSIFSLISFLCILNTSPLSHHTLPIYSKRQTVPTLSLFFKVGTVVSTVKVF